MEEEQKGKDHQIVNYKKENSVKSEQLKEKNCAIQKANSHLKKITSELENTKETLTNKVNHFETIIKNLHVKIDKNHELLCEERKKHKTIKWKKDKS